MRRTTGQKHAADSVEIDRHAMSSSNRHTEFANIFSDLLPSGETTEPLLPVYAPRALADQLSPAWPDFRFKTTRTTLRAVHAGAIPNRGVGLTFRRACLRPHTDPSGAWISSTIPIAWKDGASRPGLGERLLTSGAAALARTRGDAVAMAVVADQLGDPAAPLPAPAQRALTGGSVLVAGDDPKRDAATLRRLVQAQAAAKLTVIVRTPGSPLARMAQRAGAAVLLRDAASPWAVVHAAASIHAPLHDDIAVLGRLARRPVWTDGTMSPDCAPGLLAAAYLVLGSRYLDPANGAPIPCEAFIDRLIEWRRLRQRVPPIACFVGISFWKRQRMSEFAGSATQGPTTQGSATRDGTPRFARTAEQAVAIALKARHLTAEAGIPEAGIPGAGIAVWPSRAPKGLAEAAAAAGVPLYRVEDGFIRSRGLGADFIPPASIIIDRRGIYYDARQPSDLEALLTDQSFTPALLSRARLLMDMLITRRITKYNLGGAQQTVAFPEGVRRILVPGQVADDLSVRAGGAGIAPGLPLLAEVRRRNPDAFIVYKPHPDVEAGHRPGAVPDAELRQLADLVVRDVEMGSLIEAVDEVHTVTSLTGFEALLRHRRVVTYGRPFYAGWGLTTDIHPPPRRGRQLRLEELVAATLILYPHYLDPVTRLPCSPEQLIERLDQPMAGRTSLLVGLRRGQGAIRRLWAHRGRVRPLGLVRHIGLGIGLARRTSLARRMQGAGS
jgi:capsular polysaccharide export protein